MRYEDTSGSLSSSTAPGAHDDADTLPNGSNGPATGNVITGAGTTTGKAGADMPADAHVVAVRGASGTDTSTDGQGLHVDGRYGALVMDDHGNYKYVADGHAPEHFRDLFQYTIADAKGGQSVADLVITRGGEIQVSENAQQIVPGPDGVVTLPPGVDLSDVHVVGRNLVVTLPDGQQIVIVDGAVFVPQLVLGGVEVPSNNLAALLIDTEPKPAAGNNQSSGGNFADLVPPLDPGAPLGDLIPPTELQFPQPDFEEIGQFIDRDPEAGSATAQLDDDNMPGGNPLSNVGDDPGTDPAVGLLPGSGGDGDLTWGLTESGSLPSGFTYAEQGNGDVWVMQGADHVMTISVDPATGEYTVDQLVALDHPAGGDENNLIFTINYTVTDEDGDTAVGTLTINVDDDTPTVTVIAGSDANVQLTTDDAQTVGAASDTSVTSANFGGVFSGTTVAFGADGAGPGTSSAYTLNITSSVSGLSSHGAAINLYVVGGVVVGSTAASAAAIDAGNTIFTVSTSNTGVVTLTQFAQIDHPLEAGANDAPFADQSISMADGLVTLTRSETVVDGDGDQVTGSASVNIGANLHFTDDGPTIGLADHGEPSLTVDETDLSTNATASFAANFTASFGADGPAAAGSITYALGINAGPTGLVDVATGQAIVLVNNAGVIEGHVGSAAGALAFTVSVNAAGDVTLDQIRALSHPNTANPDDSVSLATDNLVTLTATAHDFDGDTASTTLNIGQNLHFEDDGPTISLSGQEPTLTVDETNLAVNATGSVATAFTTAFGADGAGTITYALGITGGNGTASGLIDVATGQSIVLVNNAGVIEGHVGNAAGALAFTVAIDGTGTVTLDQIRAVTHPNTNDSNDSVSLSADNLITVTGTITDKDGDSAQAVLNIGQNLNFLDDGPTISLSGQEPSLTVDETNLAANAGPTSFASAFTSAFGADGAGTITYALGITGGNGTASGLVDTATGQNIVLVLNGNTVEGHVGNAAGALAFTATVDASGNVTLDQIRAVVHPNTANPDDSVTLSADNLITLTATITDKDGDHQSATLNIGQNLNFEDDGPTAADDTDNVASGATTATGNVITGVDHAPADANATDGVADNPGADGFGAITQIHSNGTGQTDANPAGGFDVTGSYGTLHLDANGDYTYTKAPGSPGNVSETFTYTYTDKDGDSATATLTISITDSTPSATAANVVIDDDDVALAGGNPGTPAVNDDAPSNVTGNLTGSGGDGDLDFYFSASQTIPGFTTSLDNSVPGQQTLSIFQGGTLVVTVTLINETGAYTVVENHAIDHSAGNLENNLDLPVSFFAQDIDGSQSPPATMNINVDDDTPVVSLATVTEPTLTVDETNLAANAGPTSFAVLFTQSFGADGPAAAGSSTYSLGITGGNGVASGLIDVATGQSIVLVNNAGVIEGHVGNAAGAIAFTVSVNASGQVTLDQVRALSHPDANNPNDSVTLSADNLVTLTHTITDHDGDSASATANIGQNLIFLDDGPSIGLAAVAEPTLTVDETNLATNASAAFAASFTSSFGADGAGTVTYALGITGASGVASGLIDVATGSSIVLVNNAGVIEGHVGSAAGALAFTVTVNAAGTVTLDQIRAVSHPNTNDSNDSVTLSADNLVTLTATVTDKDGDHQSATLNIGQNLNFLDDGPTISLSGSENTLTVDETNLATNATAAFATAFTSSFGADGAGTVTYALTITGANGVASGLTDVATGQSIVLVNNAGVIEGHVGSTGGALAFTVTVNASGQVTLDQIRAVTHPNTNDSNDSVTLSADNLVVLTATVTDKDGDHQSAALNIGQNLNFLDDGPTISLAAVTEPTLTVDETVLATNATAAFAASFTSAFGADGAGTLTYALAITGGNGTNSGLVDTLTGQNIVLVNNAGVIEGHVGSAAGALAFTVTADASGQVTLDQIRAVVHPNAANPNDTVTLSADNLITLTATVTDKDGDHQSASLNIGQNLVFTDDAPSIGVVQNQQTDNNPATAPAVGTLHFTPGADGPGSTMTITANVTGLKSGGHDLLTVQAGNVLTAYQDTNNDGIHQAGETTVVFTLTVNPSAGTSGQYVFDLVTPLDPTVVDTPIGGSSSFGAGPEEQGQILDSATAQHLAVVSGYHTTASFNEATWLATGNLTAAMVDTAGVNGSTAGWGIDNNNFNGTDELFFWDFGAQALSNPDGAGGYEPPVGIVLPNISTATYDLIGYSSAAGDDITYVVHYTDGTFESGHIPTTDINDGTWVFTASGGRFIADIQMFTSPTGSGKVDLVSVGVQSSSLDKTPTFTVQLTDGDGDPTSTANFSVHIASGLVPFAPAAPVVLDLNGDGAHFLSLAAGVTYDYNGDGVKEATAWASPQDGILVHDANHNGTVDNASEFVFGSGSTTDLQALAAFDTNHDGKLSAADADYGSFAVWQDANSNGVVDAGEMSSLMARGIASISLTSDGVHYTAADGDVSVAGTGTYTRADGSTGSLADASFLVGGRTETGRTVSGNEASTAVLAAALAAAGLAAQPAAASPNHSSDDSSTASAGVAAAHNQALDPVPVDNASSSSMSQLTSQTAPAHQTAANANGASHGSDDTSAHGEVDRATPQTQAPTELLQGTDAPAHNAVVSETAVTAASVAMPSAQDLGGAGAAHNAVVGAVLADALHGGGGSSLDALINSLPGHGDSALDALASHGGGAVSNADSGGLAAFAMTQMGLMAHGMMMHQDAAPTHA